MTRQIERPTGPPTPTRQKLKLATQALMAPAKQPQPPSLNRLRPPRSLSQLLLLPDMEKEIRQIEALRPSDMPHFIVILRLPTPQATTARTSFPLLRQRGIRFASRSTHLTGNHQLRTENHFRVRCSKLSSPFISSLVNNASGLKGRYGELYIPSDFTNVKNTWQTSLSLNRSLKFTNRCLFHIMKKEAASIDPSIPSIDPPDADHTWNVKVINQQKIIDGKTVADSGRLSGNAHGHAERSRAHQTRRFIRDT